jgi:hypothetical protein
VDDTRCQGWAYELCYDKPVGVMYQGYVDGHWEAQPICTRHFLVVAATFDSRVELPLHCELHGFDSIGPEWTRV